MADFLAAKLKVEYMQQYGTLNLAGTAGAAGGTQQLFYATVEQKNLPWLNQGLADPAITGLIVKTPINPPKMADTLASNRDRLTGLPLDDKGRYEVNLTLGDKSYSPKYFPCAIAECVTSGGNLDMSDAGTRAYVKALDQQVFKDIGTGATAGTLVTPVGAVAGVLFWVGAAASGGQAAMSDAPFNEGRDEAMKALSEKGGAIVFEELLGHTPGAAARASALINLTGGWDAFVNRVKIDVFGMKSSETKN